MHLSIVAMGFNWELYFFNFLIRIALKTSNENNVNQRSTQTIFNMSNSKAPAPAANEMVIYRDIEHDGYWDVYAVEEGKKDTPVANLHDIDWPNTRNNESTDISSFILGKDVVVTVYSDYDFKGEHEKFTKSERNLNKCTMPDGKEDWNNEIKSFILAKK